MTVAWAVAQGALLVATLVVAALVVVDTLRVGAPPMPSSPAMQSAMVGLLPTADHCVALEVGAGWGGVAVAVARARPTWQVTAIELARVPFAASWLRQRLFGPSNLTVVFGDGLATPLDHVDVVTCYLLPDAMLRLRDRLIATGQPGAVLITAGFAVRGWTPEREVKVDDLHRTPVFRYRRPV